MMPHCNNCIHSVKLTMGKNAGTMICLSEHKYSTKTYETETDCEAFDIEPDFFTRQAKSNPVNFVRKQ